MCSVHHITLQASPSQFFFTRDILLNVKFIADLEAIRIRKETVISQDNIGEYSLRVVLQVGSQILITNKDITRKVNCPTKDSFQIIHVDINGTIIVQNCNISEQINIRHFIPYIL